MEIYWGCGLYYLKVKSNVVVNSKSVESLVRHFFVCKLFSLLIIENAYNNQENIGIIQQK